MPPSLPFRPHVGQRFRAFVVSGGNCLVPGSRAVHQARLPDAVADRALDHEVQDKHRDHKANELPQGQLQGESLQFEFKGFHGGPSLRHDCTRVTAADVCDSEFLAATSMGLAYALWALIGLLCLVAGGLVVVLG